MNVAIIQARMGSTRLPGKVLKEVKGKPLLGYLLDRVRLSAKIDKILVAVSDAPEDDCIAGFCTSQDVECLRGNAWDVLDRFYSAAHLLPELPDTIVRITADCPLHHGEVVDFALTEYFSSGADYFSNSFPPDYEDGCDTEVFSYAALETAWREAKLLSQREHVTPYIKDSGKFICAYKKFSSGYHYKLSVDTPDDFHAVSAIINHFYPNTLFSIEEIVGLLKKRPDILAYNKTSVINAGYSQSLKNDREIK